MPTKKRQITVNYSDLNVVQPTDETEMPVAEMDALMDAEPIDAILHLGRFSKTQLWFAINFALNAGHFRGLSRRALERARDELDYADIRPDRRAK